MQDIAAIVLPTFFAIALGYLFGRVSRLSSAVLIDVAMYVAIPCLVITSMLSTPIVMSEAVELWASSLLILGGTFVVARIVFALTKSKHSGLYLAVVFANLVNIPFPIIYLAFGAEGLAKAALFYMPYGILVYSVGVYVAAGQSDLKQGVRVMLRTPLIYAAVLGLMLNLAGVVLPDLVMNSLKFVGQAGVPLILLVLGMNIGKIRPAHIPLTLTAGVMRMGGGFAFGLLAVWLLGITGVARSVVIFEAAMPSAILVAIMATKYKNEAELVSSVVLVTTMASIVVIPVLLYYLM
jgi:malate permease and related proteins